MSGVWVSYFAWLFLIEVCKQSGRTLILLINILSCTVQKGWTCCGFESVWLRACLCQEHLHATLMFWFDPAVLPHGATYSIRGSKFILDWRKMRHVRSLHIQPFLKCGNHSLFHFLFKTEDWETHQGDKFIHFKHVI